MDVAARLVVVQRVVAARRNERQRAGAWHNASPVAASGSSSQR